MSVDRAGRTIPLEDVLDLINAAGIEAHDAGDEAGEQAIVALRISMEALADAALRQPDQKGEAKDEPEYRAAYARAVDSVQDPEAFAKWEREQRLHQPAPVAGMLPSASRFPIGARVRKTKGSSWTGHVVGHYRTALTPDGVCVESENEPGSVQIYPVAALALFAAAQPPLSLKPEGGDDSETRQRNYRERTSAHDVAPGRKCEPSGGAAQPPVPTGETEDGGERVQDLHGLATLLRGMCIDYNDADMADGEEPRRIPTCGELRLAADALEAQGRTIAVMVEALRPIVETWNAAVAAHPGWLDVPDDKHIGWAGGAWGIYVRDLRRAARATSGRA